MADDDQNNDDEYQFDDLDVLGAEQDSVSLPEEDLMEGADEGVSSPPGRGRFDQLDPKVVQLIRNGVIAVGALLVVVVAYKTIGSFFSSSKSKKEITPVAKTMPTATPSQSSSPIPVRTQTTALTTKTTGVDGKLSALKQEQKRIETELSTMRTQMGAVTQSVNDMSAKMADVKQTMLVLSERLEQQSNQMGRLQSMNRAKRVSSRPAPPRTPAAPKATYSVQAIIPGRAWLMSSQGKTLTVSRGSVVPGYGVVRLVNAKIGRVFTSSGRVIQFSQADR
ncbi:MAG: type IVB secretion system protein IcmG/DotF [Gammaproteobacteria bacterium]|nr:type IVB secretion system protein IcmG/DotF [Gammaproteobacteria bacterium]